MSHIQPFESTKLAPMLNDLKALIDQTRQQVAVAVNTGLTHLYWQVGQRIRTDLLRDEDRAAYGKRILATLSQELTQRYGKGFTESALNRIVQFAAVFPDPLIVATLSRQLNWPHFASSQAPAWEFSAGSSSFLYREARASSSGFPSWSLGTRKYLTALPPREVLERKLHEAVASARARLVQRPGDGELGI